MFKTIVNNLTGVVHAVDDNYYTNDHTPFAVCGGIRPFTERLTTNSFYRDRDKRNQVVTCKNCLRALRLIPPPAGKRKRPVTPLVAVDGIIEYNKKLIVIERLNPPLGLAWPGGFVDVGETVEDALHREMEEEVNLKIKIVKLVGIYSDPDRDDRGHTVSICYLCEAIAGHPKAQDDAKAVHQYTLSEVLRLKMVLDHDEMLYDALILVQHPLRSRVWN